MRASPTCGRWPSRSSSTWSGLFWPSLLAIGVRFGRLRRVLIGSVLAIATVMNASMLMTAPDITRI